MARGPGPESVTVGLACGLGCTLYAGSVCDDSAAEKLVWRYINLIRSKTNHSRGEMGEGS